MTDDITKHVEALRAKVPAMAEQAFIYLSCDAWRGWKPADIFAVQETMYDLLAEVLHGSIVVQTGGLVARVEKDADFGWQVLLGFEATCETVLDPFEGTIAVVGV